MEPTNQIMELPPALAGDKSVLSEEAMQEIRALSGAKPKAFFLQVLSAWIAIIVAVLMAEQSDEIWASLIAIVIIATRMNILGLLVHEQVHSLGLRNRFGDGLINLLTAYPLGITVENYAQVHLSHHKHYFTENDPDFLRKSGPDWTFPMPWTQVLKLVLSDLSGLSFLKLLRGKRLQNSDVFNRRFPTPEWLRPSFYLALAILLTALQAWPLFFVYWLLPLFALMPLIVRLGAVCEHVYGKTSANVIESSPLILLRWWEKLLLPNLNFTLHAYHHFFPGMAFCNLPKVHAIFQREGLVNGKNLFHGYSGYLRYLQSAHGMSGFRDQQEQTSTHPFNPSKH